jgi:hypothetical protein
MNQTINQFKGYEDIPEGHFFYLLDSACSDAVLCWNTKLKDTHTSRQFGWMKIKEDPYLKSNKNAAKKETTKVRG